MSKKYAQMKAEIEVLTKAEAMLYTHYQQVYDVMNMPFTAEKRLSSHMLDLLTGPMRLRIEYLERELQS